MRLAVAFLAALAMLPGAASGFVLSPYPPASRRAMNLHLLPETPFSTMGYGVQTWNGLAERALTRWNTVGIGPGEDHGFFSVRRPAVAGDACNPDGINEVRFGSDHCGMGWGDALAVTTSWILDGRAIETDIVFNNTVAVNAYPGPLRFGAGGALVVDFYRVALHELGHAAGLGHPDDGGQSIAAVMNAIVSNVDELQTDDIAGAHAICWDVAQGPGGAPATLVAAVLPGSRSVMLGQSATAYATVINTGGCPANDVRIALPASVGATLTFQTTDPVTNVPTGSANVPADIPAGGRQTFLFSLTPSTPLTASVLALDFSGDGVPPASTVPGLNTFLLSASTGLTPDIIAVAATLANDGIVRVPGATGTGVFAVATSNVGSGAAVTVSGDARTAQLPLIITICQTNPASGSCLAPPDRSVTLPVMAGATPTFGVFVRFNDGNGITRGLTSVAVRTQ